MICHRAQAELGLLMAIEASCRQPESKGRQLMDVLLALEHLEGTMRYGFHLWRLRAGGRSSVERGCSYF